MLTDVNGERTSATYYELGDAGRRNVAILDLRYRKRGDPWSPLWMYLLHSESPEVGGAPREYTELPWHARNVVVMKKRAREVLEPPLTADAEILACECDDAAELSLAQLWAGR